MYVLLWNKLNNKWDNYMWIWENILNTYMAHKILLTILVIAIYEKISFLELKVIKSYLISIMSQQD